MQTKKMTLGIVGGRGYVGQELIRLLAYHPKIQLKWVSSRTHKGIKISELFSNEPPLFLAPLSKKHYYQQLYIDAFSKKEIAQQSTDIIVLALPNGLANDFVLEIENKRNSTILLDLSADYRFNKEWHYSLPELTALHLNAAIKKYPSKPIKISNPGCYATAMQLALAPIRPHLSGTAHAFGVSGFSGAGTQPSKNNDPGYLKENLIPYGLTEHLHEKEVSYHLNYPICFSPHVAPFFRGISITFHLTLLHSWTLSSCRDLYHHFYESFPNIIIQNDIPYIQDVVCTEKTSIGGFSLSENKKNLTLVCSLDNLLKGAASQALQTIEYVLKNIQSLDAQKNNCSQNGINNNA
jgi:N-acetyl-gamma-glutamyl-phosphate reductase common form